MAQSKNLNVLALKILSPILILTGGLGYLIPQELFLKSTTSYYNLFYIDAGLLGMIVLFTMNAKIARFYNIFLGLIFVYQALASHFNLFPETYFQWTLTDDIVNMDIGLILLFIGIMNFGGKPQTQQEL
ncbi:MAG TPA: hypothetical protein VIK89_16835 [Cytophagaceae bacterium]